MDLINAWKMEHIYDVVVVSAAAVAAAAAAAAAAAVVVVVVVVHEYEVQCNTERYYCGKLYKA
jgi:hypothetical protein